MYVFFKDYAKTFTTPVLTNFFWWLLLRMLLRLAVWNSSGLQQMPSKGIYFCKNYIKRITRARKWNVSRYLVWVNKRLLSITKQQYRRSQDLPSTLVQMNDVFSELGNFKLSCYIHQNKLSRLPGLRKFALFNKAGCLFPRN